MNRKSVRQPPSTAHYLSRIITMPVALFAALLLGSTLFAAPATRPKPAPAAPDAAIEQNIKARFAKSKISEDKFTVRVQRGVAILEGTTNVIQRKGTATRLAKLGGAASVDNRIRIGDEARQKAAAKLSEHKPRPTARPAVPKKVASPETAAVAPQPTAIPRAVVKH
jgi:hypothetical protein